MIIEQIPNIKPYPFNGQAVKQLGEIVPIIVPDAENEICICDYITCQYQENVFRSADGLDYKNDKSEFLFKRLVTGDSIIMKLLKNNVEVATLDDDALGELFDGFTSGSSEQEKYVGFVIDWNAVYLAEGAGIYSLEADLNILGTTSTYTSREFKLQTYSDLAADNTVKIESVQNGNIIGSEFDFTGLNWRQYLRIPGRFGNPTPEYETERYQDTNYNFKQIKDTMSQVWDLNTKLLPWEVANKLVYNKVLANEIYITDYSIKAESIWRRIRVRLSEIEKPPLFNSTDKRYLLKFVNNKNIYQKRNF
jgi:hypothetical protein